MKTKSVSDNEMLKYNIYLRAQVLDGEMNTILGMVNSYSSPRNGKRPPPADGIEMLKKAVSTKTKIAAFVDECKKTAL
jgi:hypothetical protein